MTRQLKVNHTRVILAAQACQRSFGYGDGAEALAELSERSSACSRDRAASLAAGYWELEKDGE